MRGAACADRSDDADVIFFQIEVWLKSFVDTTETQQSNELETLLHLFSRSDSHVVQGPSDYRRRVHRNDPRAARGNSSVLVLASPRTGRGGRSRPAGQLRAAD